MTKSVVDLDLVGYSTIALTLEESANDPRVVFDLNQQIQAFVDEAIAATGVVRSEALLSNTGDGAILMFNSAVQAHRFAVRLQEVSAKWNEGKTGEFSKRFFRVGVATGPIKMQEHDGEKQFAGIVIARAVRFEAAGTPGTVLIDEATAKALPAEERHLYAGPEAIAGKRDEVYEAYRYVIDRSAAGASKLLGNPSRTSTARGGASLRRQTEGESRREILRLLHGLRPHQYDELIFLLEIPIDRRPPRATPVVEKRAIILEWAEEDEGVRVLYEELKLITDRH